MKKRKLIMILARPVKAPQWWPKNKGKAAWVTVRVDGKDPIGWTLGEDESEAVRLKDVNSIEDNFVELIMQCDTNFKEKLV